MKKQYRLNGKFCSKNKFIDAMRAKNAVLQDHFIILTKRLRGNLSTKTLDDVANCLNALNRKSIEINQIILEAQNG